MAIDDRKCTSRPVDTVPDTRPHPSGSGWRECSMWSSTDRGKPDTAHSPFSERVRYRGSDSQIPRPAESGPWARVLVCDCHGCLSTRVSSLNTSMRAMSSYLEVATRGPTHSDPAARLLFLQQAPRRACTVRPRPCTIFDRNIATSPGKERQRQRRSPAASPFKVRGCTSHPQQRRLDTVPRAGERANAVSRVKQLITRIDFS